MLRGGASFSLFAINLFLGKTGRLFGGYVDLIFLYS